MIDVAEMMAASQAVDVKGQVVLTSSQSFVVPPGVTSLAMVCVQEGCITAALGSEVVVAGTVVCRARNGARIGDGGGDGGLGEPGYSDDNYGYVGGSGGAGGYTGNGGKGTAPGGGTAFPGSGGGGAGGDAGSFDGSGSVSLVSAGGGGVGLLGQGASGSTYRQGGSGGENGSPMVPNALMNKGGNYGGGSGRSGNGDNGGALAWKNNVAVTPGQSITVTIAAAYSTNGAVRLIWGGSRSYPNNAGDL